MSARDVCVCCPISALVGPTFNSFSHPSLRMLLALCFTLTHWNQSVLLYLRVSLYIFPFLSFPPASSSSLSTLRPQLKEPTPRFSNGQAAARFAPQESRPATQSPLLDIKSRSSASLPSLSSLIICMSHIRSPCLQTGDSKYKGYFGK